MAPSATQPAVTPTDDIQLPLLLSGPADLNRLIREFESLDDFFDQAAIRHPGVPVQMPKVSRMLDECITLNGLDLSQPAIRQTFYEALSDIKFRAPVMHMSFAADPSSAFIAKIITWLRANIHPQLLLTIGLEPSIAAGCVVRTANKQFDFSLRRRFDSQRDLLNTLLTGQAAEQTGGDNVNE